VSASISCLKNGWASLQSFKTLATLMAPRSRSGVITFQANYEGGDGNDLTLTVVQ